jgi:hypothetical protein
MGIEALAALPRDVGQPTAKEAVASCPIEGLTLILSRLLQRHIEPAAVLERAVGLGLMRLPPAGAPTRLSLETASRLFLSGYRLPAQAEPAMPAGLRGHLAEGRHVFLILGETEPAVVPLHGLLPEDVPAWSLASAFAAAAPPIEGVPAEWLCDAWQSSGWLTVAAARRWEDLPASGTRFFGGTREKDGSYHWDAADCDTDATGRILRVW